ncbi:YdcH family protein [Rhizobium sp. SGZ-381]|uniref:YdcH family protein n=1 Tax=Rhizobium sp. SGZ-381 TaxID=3342800 RepID=UPI0036727D0A
MSNTPHHLAEEFPDHLVLMRHLRETDGHFHRLAVEYEDINHRIHRAETDIEPSDDLFVAELRKQRLALKDELYGMLTLAEPRPETIEV